MKKCQYAFKEEQYIKKTLCFWFHENTKSKGGLTVMHFPLCSCDACPLTNKLDTKLRMAEMGLVIK